MKQSLPCLLLCGLLCTGCTGKTTNPESPQQTETAAPDPATAAASTGTATEITTATSSSVPADTTSSTDPEQPEAAETLFTAPEISAPDYQGGDGGEEHAETPLPQYFTYRFFENGVSMRLAGGNYQSLEADLSEVTQLQAETEYYLYDSDFDGDLDLSVPVRLTDAEKAYAVFLWDDADAHFKPEPVLLRNPQYYEDVKHICTLQQERGHGIVTESQWTDGSLQTVLTADADYEALTLNITDANGKALTDDKTFDDEQALTDALLRYYERKKAD